MPGELSVFWGNVEQRAGLFGEKRGSLPGTKDRKDYSLPIHVDLPRFL